jgi:NTP pyrophosphatase (non-canonical NTP hydrolase)
MTQLDDLIKTVGEINEAHGFNEYKDIPDEYKKFYIGSKLMLMVTELGEAFEEIRSGHAPEETYYPAGPVPASFAVEFGSGAEATEEWKKAQGERAIKKPEGFPSELADAFIRLLSLTYEVEQAYGIKIPLEEAIYEKMAYNATRPYRHGRAF